MPHLLLGPRAPRQDPSAAPAPVAPDRGCILTYPRTGGDAPVHSTEKTMATNPPSGDGHRNGAVRDRSQVHNPRTDTWTKRDSDTGRFMDGKKDGTPFKGVRKER